MGITLDVESTTTTSGGGGGGGASVVQQYSGSHLLQIDGYSIAKQIPNIVSLKSCPFTVGGYRWMLHLFPNGDRPENVGFISVFIGLYNYDERHRVDLQVEFSFIDEVHKHHPAHLRTRQVLELVYRVYGVGYSRFISREALENSKQHLQGDRFTIRCDFLFTAYADDFPDKDILRPMERKCAACNLHAVKLGRRPLLHACFCDLCNQASRDDPAAKQCLVCHGPYQGRCVF